MFNIQSVRPDWLDPNTTNGGAAQNGLQFTNIAGAARSDFPVILGSASGTINVGTNMPTSSLLTLTPNGATTLNGVQLATTWLNYEWTVLLTSDGNSRIVTFGTNFNSNGPVNTGPTSGVVTAVKFVSTPTGVWQEVLRNTYGAGSTTSFLYSAAGTALPACAAANKGAIASVSDATATTYNSIYAGSGTNVMPVLCDGTNWRLH
jgi:hypothetical protein